MANSFTQSDGETACRYWWKSAACFATEVILLVGLFSLLSPGSAPGVNEPHYLCKAKHFWNASFCQGDAFLESADAHFLFYVSLGWLTKWFSLPTSALLGRMICWTAIAIGWRMLSNSLIRRPGVSVLTAGLTLAILHHFHFAGEWLIGGVEAKGLAYGFLFAGMSYLVRGRWGPVWILFGTAAAFHVLVGGWAVIVGGFSWLFSFGKRGSWKTNLLSLAIGFGISLIGLVPAILLTTGHDPEIVSEANRIYTFDRIAHHLVFSHIGSTTPARLDFFATAVLLWIAGFCLTLNETKLRLLNFFVLGTLIISFVAVGIDYLTIQRESLGEERSLELAAKLLRYYWFRLSDVFVPIGLSFILAMVMHNLFEKHYSAGAMTCTFLIGLVAAQVVWIQYQKQIDQRSQADQLTLPSFGSSADPGIRNLNQKTYADWVDVCCWIRSATDSTARFITPRNQSTFKWYAHRSEVVSWKDVPQDAPGIVEWKKRFDHVFKFDNFRFGLAGLNAERRLLDLGKQYDAQYVVIERRHVRNRKQYVEFLIEFVRLNDLAQTELRASLQKPLFLKQVYPNRNCSPDMIRGSSYLVYELVVPQAYQSSLRELDRLFQSTPLQ